MGHKGVRNINDDQLGSFLRDQSNMSDNLVLLDMDVAIVTVTKEGYRILLSSLSRTSRKIYFDSIR